MYKRFCRSLNLIVALSAVYAWAGEDPKRIYVAPDDHTDYYWTATGDAYRQAFLDTLDYYLDKADETIGNPADFQSRWNCDGCLWMWEYEKNKPAAEFQRLINRIKTGHISVPLTALVSCYGGAPVEGVLRGMYYPGRIERRFNLRFNLAVSMENQTLPLGLGALWAGSGARYTWKGICGCATKVPSPGDREHEIYWWEGPDGSRVLTKWYSLFGNQSIGGYAEAYSPVTAINLIDTNATFLARYPYNVIGVFGQGWDGFQTMDQQVVNAAQSESNANRRVIVSNELDFFEDFEATHGAGLPTLSVAYGNEWELYCASMAEVTAGVRRAVERLRGAEALATLVALKDSDFLDGREGARDLAFMNLGLYWEHDWTADGPVGRNPRAEWQRLIGEQIEDYVETLLSDSVAALGGLIRRSGERQRFFAFNPLGWTRTDHADYPYSGPLPVHVVELSSGSEVPSQIVTLEGQPHIRILARNVPPVGYKTFEIVLGAGQAFTPAATVAGSVIENAFYRITLTDRGAITSLLDKTRGNREMVRTIGGLAMNDLGAGGGSLAVENSGPVSVTLKADSPTPLAHLSRITLFREINRIDIRNEITQNFGDVRTWSFGFELDNPDVWHEEVGAVIRAKLLADGGHYSGHNARYDWLTLNHFADIGDGAVGATLSSADCCFMRLGNSTATTLDTATPRISPLAGGQVDGAGLGIPNQHGDSHFLQRFALATHGAFSRREAMKFSLEHQNPLVAGAVTGGPHYPEEQFSLVTVSNPDVLLWALKPAEEGIGRGLAARFWNLSNSPSNFTLTLHGASVEQAMTATHLETETGPATLSSGSLSASLAPQQLKTFLLTVAPSSGVAKWELY